MFHNLFSHSSTTKPKDSSGRMILFAELHNFDVRDEQMPSCWLCVSLSPAVPHQHSRLRVCVQTHILSCSACYPHVGKNNCSCCRALLSGCYKGETPVCPRPYIALNGSAEASSVQCMERQHQEATYHILVVWNVFPFSWNMLAAPGNSDVTMNVPLCLCSTVGLCQVF